MVCRKETRLGSHLDSQSQTCINLPRLKKMFQIHTLGLMWKLAPIPISHLRARGLLWKEWMWLVLLAWRAKAQRKGL